MDERRRGWSRRSGDDAARLCQSSPDASEQHGEWASWRALYGVVGLHCPDGARGGSSGPLQGNRAGTSPAMWVYRAELSAVRAHSQRDCDAGCARPCLSLVCVFCYETTMKRSPLRVCALLFGSCLRARGNRTPVAVRFFL